MTKGDEQRIDCAELCPDNRKDDFEYGAYEIVRGLLLLTHSKRKSPKYLREELEVFVSCLDRLSLDAQVALDGAAGINLEPLNGVTAQMRHIANKAIEEVPHNPQRKRDEVRLQLGREAASMWVHHKGKIEDDAFFEFVEILLTEADLDENDKKNRVNARRLVKEVRADNLVSKPLSWNLWGYEDNLL